MNDHDGKPLTPEEEAAWTDLQRVDDRISELSVRLQEAHGEDLTGYLEALRDELRSLASEGPLAPVAANMLALADVMIGTSIRQERMERDLAVLQETGSTSNQDLSEISERIARLEAQR